MHKSVGVYAAAVGSAGHVRRLIRAGLVPSARLVKGVKGRPGWVIEDTSPEAVETLKNTLEAKKRGRPTFWEPVIVECFNDKGPDGKPSLSYEVRWHEIFRPPPLSGIDVLFELADRAALVWHGLTRHDLFHPPIHYPDKYRCLTDPLHQRKVEAYYRTQRRLLSALFKPRTSFTYRWVNRVADADFRTVDIMQAALHLGLYHKLYGREIEIGHQNLGRVLGISKSTLYRNYGKNLVNEALRVAHRYAQSATQRSQHELERAHHPGRKLETQQQSEGAFNTQDEPDLQGTSIKDLPFSVLYDAANQLIRTGKAANAKTLTAYLRQQARLSSTENVSQFYSDGVISNAIAAARTAMLG
jgi:hypothetical protein